MPAAILALFGTTVKAEPTTVIWTCWASSSDTWTMLQPKAHFDAGLYPSWSDCESWRYGAPDGNYTWSYGLPTTTTIQTTSTTSTTVELTTTTYTSTTVPPTTDETWVTTTESTTTTTTSTTGVPTTTVPAETTTTSTTTTTQPWVPPATTTSSTTTSTTTTIVLPSTTVESTTSLLETTTTALVTTVPKQSSTTTTTQTTIPVETTIAASPTTIPVPQSIIPVNNLDAQQASQVFAQLDTTQLDDTEIQAIIEAVQDAPTEVREAFEENVDVFGAGFDDYVPLGSTVPVETRRTLIAVAAGTGLAAVGSSRRNK